MRTTIPLITGLTGLLAPLVVVGVVGMTSPAQAAETMCDGRVATIVVTPTTSLQTAPVVGTPGDDVIVGTPQWDTIDGGGGNDLICGLDGADTLTGGEGDDRLFGGLDADYSFDDGYFGDLLVPGPGDDHVDVGADDDSLDICQCDGRETTDRISYEGASTGVDIDLGAGVATGEGLDTLVAGGAVGVLGSPYDDRIVGTDEVNVVKAGAGSDTVDTGDGPDQVWLDEIPPFGEEAPPTGARDSLDAGPGRDIVQSSGGDTIDTGDQNDTVHATSVARGSVRAGGGNDDVFTVGPFTIRGGGGKDQIIASFTRKARQVLDGESGRDQLFVRLESDVPGRRITVDLPKGRMSVAGQRATVRVGGMESLLVRGLGQTKSQITFIGTGRADSIRAVRATLRAFGGGGDDSLFGFRGNDLLDGGPGRDTLDGFLGRDRCVNGEKVSQCEVRR